MGTEVQLPHNFCTGVLKDAKIVFCAESDDLWQATFLDAVNVCSTCS